MPAVQHITAYKTNVGEEVQGAYLMGVQLNIAAGNGTFTQAGAPLAPECAMIRAIAAGTAVLSFGPNGTGTTPKVNLQPNVAEYFLVPPGGILLEAAGTGAATTVSINPVM